jgi:hypothetical protein
LSKIIVEHFGHFVQSPSGISFLRDLAAESFGFLGSGDSAGKGGGVNAASTPSTPRSVFRKNPVIEPPGGDATG